MNSNEETPNADLTSASGQGRTVEVHIRHISGAVLYTAQVPSDTPSGLRVRAALEQATAAGAYLAGAFLARAYLAGAFLARAYLAGASLAEANLAGAYLAGAYLAGANLAEANLAGANLAGANLAGAKDADLVIARTRILPEGSLIGWKKCNRDVIVKISIPAEAKRSHAFGRKCRAEFVDVLEVFGGEVGVSLHDGTTKYTKGARVTADVFCADWQQECAGGIHFYLTRLEAENH